MKIEEIISVVEVELSVDLGDIRRKNPLVDARIIVAVIALNFGFSTTQIGKSLSKDHSVVTYYKKQFFNLQNDKNFKAKYSSCIKAFDDYAEKNVYVDDSNVIEELRIRKHMLEKRLKLINQVLEGK